MSCGRCAASARCSNPAAGWGWSRPPSATAPYKRPVSASSRVWAATRTSAPWTTSRCSTSRCGARPSSRPPPPGTKKPMLALPMWRPALEQAGFGVEIAGPGEERTPLRQHLIVARAERTGRLCTDDIERDLRARFGDLLPAVRVRQCERIGTGDAPATAGQATAGKARGPCAPAVPLQPAKAGGDGAPDRAALERQVAAIWQALLARPIPRDGDFFQSGGDSLIATRMIARLHRQGLRGASLQGLFNHPTLAGFCALLEPPLKANAHSTPISLAQGRQAGSAFVFHASDGELGAYLPLARHLDTAVFGLQAPDCLKVGSLKDLAADHAAAIRRQQPQGPYTLIGWSYGAFVAAETARLLHHSGAQVELSLIDPVCRADFAFTDRAALLRLIANGRVQVPLPDALEQLGPDEQVACFARNAAAAGLLASEPDPAQARGWIDRIAHLLEMLARHPAPEPLPVQCLWLSANQRPALWTPAEHDWSLWAPDAQRRTLDADHWQLVMDETAAGLAAGLMRQWQQRHNGMKEQTA